MLGRRLRRCPEARVALRSKRQRHARTGAQQTLPWSCWHLYWPVTASATPADSSPHCWSRDQLATPRNSSGSAAAGRGHSSTLRQIYAASYLMSSSPRCQRGTIDYRSGKKGPPFSSSWASHGSCPFREQPYASFAFTFRANRSNQDPCRGSTLHLP